MPRTRDRRQSCTDARGRGRSSAIAVVQALALADDLVRRSFRREDAQIDQDEKRDGRLQRECHEGEAQAPAAQMLPHPPHRAARAIGSMPQS